MHIKRALTFLAATTAAATAFAAAPAYAGSEYNGVVDSGEFGLYWSTGSRAGTPVMDMVCGENDFSQWKFPGYNIKVNDNTLSYRNRSTDTWYVFTDAYQGGASGSLPPGYVGDASKTFQNSISSAYNSTCF